MAEKRAQNKDYYADLIEDKPIERALEIGDKSKPVWFRLPTAGERQQLNAGQVYRTSGSPKDGGARETTMEMDLGDNDRRRQMLVFFMNVHEDGKQVFTSASQVGNIPGPLFEALHKLASEVDEEAKKEDAGKSSSKTPS